MDLTRLTSAVCAESEIEKTFVKYCREIGLIPEDLHKTVKQMTTNNLYEIIGMKKCGRAYFLIGKNLKNNVEINLDIRKIHNTYYYTFIEE